MTGHDAGYERINPFPADNAVRWWFWDSGDGFHFARGGRVRTCRQARAEIRQARAQVLIERRLHDRKPTHRLEDDGAITPIALDKWHHPGHLVSVLDE